MTATARAGLSPLLWVGLGIALLGCEDVPKDPENTLDRARGGTLRVGVSESPPWVTGAEGAPGGLEPALVRAFAEEIDARVEWVRGGQEEHLEALETFELDLVAAGLTAGSPWKTRVGFTRPYLHERWVVGVPAGVPEPESLEGLEIGVPETGPAAAWVREKGARPVSVPDLAEVDGPVAAPEWKLESMGYRATDHHLHTVKRVLAAAPGENGLIVRLEESLREARLGGPLESGSP